MPELARRVALQVNINGHDATDFVSPSLIDLTYTDQASGKADEVQITLHDREGQWRNQWTPEKHMPVTVSIVCRDWFAEGDSLALPCGSFRVDEVEYKGPPATLAIKAVSASLTTDLRDTAKTRAWEGKGLQDLASQIAGEHGLSLMYQGNSPVLGRVDQRNESDLAFVQRLAQARGMACKVHDGKLAIYDLEESEAQDAILTVKPSGENEPTTTLVPQSWSFREKSSGTAYDKADVSYADPQTGTTHKAEVQRIGRDAGIPSLNKQKTLTLETRTESAGEAIALGKGAMQDKNKDESTCSLDFMGDPRLVAGIVLQLDGFGRFGGRYLVKKATHKVSRGGYTTSVDLTRCGVTSGVWAVRATDEAMPATTRPEPPQRMQIVLDAFKSAEHIIQGGIDSVASYASAWANIKVPPLPPLPDPEPEPEPGPDTDGEKETEADHV